MSYKQNNSWNTVPPKRPPQHSHHKRGDDSPNTQRIVISDDFRKELAKNDILVDKWYHRLFTGQYYKSNGAYYYEEPILKRLANEYQKALHIRNIDAMILIRNELFNHLPEPVWIYKYLSGDVCNSQGHPLNRTTPELMVLSQEYIQLYNRVRDTTSHI